MQYQIYKPYTDKATGKFKGFASTWKCDQYGKGFFVEIASQLEEKLFDWKNKIIVSLSVEELGDILGVIYGKQDGVELFHQCSDGTSKTIKFEFKPSDKGPRYLLSIAHKRPDGPVNRFHYIVPREAEVIRVMCEKSIGLMLEAGKRKRKTSPTDDVSTDKDIDESPT